MQEKETMTSPPNKRPEGKPDVHKKPKKRLEWYVYVGLIVVCVLGIFLCGAMIPAYLDDPVPLIVLAGLFAAGAFAAASQL
jgi:hypothetical protein